jgi:hypothetical protein
VAQLIVDLLWFVHRTQNLVAQDFAVTLSHPVNRHAHGWLVHSKARGEFDVRDFAAAAGKAKVERFKKIALPCIRIVLL